MKNYKIQMALALVCIVLGIMLSIQFKTVKTGIGPVSENRARELASQLKNVKAERDDLLAIKNDLDKKIREYEQQASTGSVSAKLLKAELDNARIIAGLEDVEGPGIIITLDDLMFGETVGFPLISHDRMLLLVNELNAAGAEAIAINDQRIISTTEIRQAGTHININTVEFAPPFKFKAIGDPKTLEGAIMMRGGIIEDIQNSEIAVTVTQEKNIKIPKYNGVIEKKFSKVVKEGEAQ
ncbi:MAG TPA: DUF881 domain-containing protein [Patescibacteria group bacterium]|jgi:uncharacterized protein YlxW (UPF0749 family)|nr:DUF881 domain-containing protein [Patescibacteria group bacterium]